jgi:peptidoglycan lytic transglycosylase
MRTAWVVGILAAFVFVAGCAPRAGYMPRPLGWTEKGDGCWYGEKFHGRSTASGEPFDMYALTAAHKSLPFGTKVKVRNRNNSRSVVVRINDRGPFVRGRIIDLSYGAAKKLDMIAAGVVPVTIEVVGIP